MWFIYDIILFYPFFIQKTQENEGGNCLTPLFLDSKLPSPGFCRDHFKYVASELLRFSPYFKTTHQPRTFLGTVNSYTKKTPLFVDVDSPRFQKKCQRVKKSTHFKRKSHLFTNPINDHQWLQGLLLFLSNIFKSHLWKKNINFPATFPGWWFQLIWKIWVKVKLDIFSQLGVKIKHIWNHHHLV